MVVAEELVDRFRRDLDLVTLADARLGIAVSGGPDSLALLLLAARSRPDAIAAATVDHQLRPESASEAKLVASVCKQLKVPHQVVNVAWAEKPESGIQARARAERYRLLSEWASNRRLDALVTAHHMDDQAETFLMRLARGSGVKGLAGMRAVALTPGSDLRLVRPLLGWRRSELEALCESAGLQPIEDPSNADEQFERVRMRHALADADWLDPAAIARSASNLSQADGALHWATTQAWDRLVTVRSTEITFRAQGLPREIRRRLARRAILQLATEGRGAELRGRELDQLVPVLNRGGRATLRGVLCTGGPTWRFIPAPNRTRPVDNSR